MHLYQMIDEDLMKFARIDGLIRRQEHPTLPLDIYNYTERAQFTRHWNEATLNCRGLIVNRETGRVVARPFPKFFNYGEQDAATFDLDEPVSVTDKVDGSLGILYPVSDHLHLYGHAIATRGSFTSEQAEHATKVWQGRYAEDFQDRMNPRLTYLFEIVYPENRIVVDYKGLDDLVLIGAVDIETGTLWGPEIAPGWPGPRARVFPYQTLRAAVHSRPRDGKEGFVVRSLDQTRMVKVKYDKYVSLHRVVTGLNEKEIWRQAMKIDLDNGPEVDKLDLLLWDIPDELHEWVIGVVRRLTDQFASKMSEAKAVFYQGAPSLITGLNEREVRAVFAARIKHREKWLQKALWILYDGNDPREFLWKTLEPRGDVKK